MSFFNKKDKDHQEQTTVGIIDFGKGLDNCKICICNEGKEEEYPHFHIIGIEKDFETAVLLYGTKYNSHCGKYRDWLNEDQLAILNINMIDGLWDKLKISWKEVNPIDQCPKSHILETPPDYTKMIYPESMFYDISTHEVTHIYLDSGKDFDIIIYEHKNGGKGVTPHFHLCREDMSLECSICIFENKYYLEDNKKDTLNEDQKRYLSNILNSQCKFTKQEGYTTWKEICESWYARNPKSKKYKIDKIPDYMLL